MARVFSVGTIPKNIPTWQYNAFRQIAAAITGVNNGQSAILRGEAPDGSGLPLIDTSKFFYKPGLSGGQVAYGDTLAAGTLVLSSTAAPTKGKIYFDSSKTLMAFDESQGFLGIGTVAPAALLHLYRSSGALARLEPATFSLAATSSNGSPTLNSAGLFAPSGGPRVVPGMYITGPGITAGTQVKNLTSGSVLTMTANAGAGAGAGTFTFQTYTDMTAISDETGRDMQFDVKGGVRFSTGTDSTAPLRIVGDTETVAANVVASARVYLEVGTISGGSAVGTNLQIGGPGHGDLGNLFIRSSNIYIDEPNSGSQTNMGLGLNPAEYNAQLGPAINFTIKQTATVGLSILGTSTGTLTIFSILPSAATSGTSPNKAIDQTTFFFKVTEEARTWFGNGAGNGSYITANGTSFTFTAGTAGLPLFAVAAAQTLWSDSAITYGVQLGALTGTSAKRVVLTNAGNGVFDRFAVSAVYHLITNAQSGNAEFLAPATNQEVLQVANSSSNGNNASVVLKVRTQRSGQTANIQEWMTSGGAAISAINAAGAFAGNTTLVSFEDSLVFLDDDTVYY